MTERCYHYLGDRLTDPSLIGVFCTAVLRPDGKCVCGGGKMLVRLIDGRNIVVIQRMLRKVQS